MENKAFFITAKELAERGADNIPRELVSGEHLIYSSPATLAFNSPGAQGFGVKRAGLAVPESVMLLVAPGCCGRNTAALSGNSYDERFFYLLLDDTDIVTGRHLTKIPEAVKEVCESCEKKPSAVMICITCVDALLGTDMERVCRKCEDFAGVPTVPCYMYALTRENRLPPMTAVRKAVYSLLKKQSERDSTAVNILGYFSQLDDNCELYTLLESVGVKKIREISRCKSFEEYLSMSGANFNLVLNPEARYAAVDMENNLGIPSVELRRMYRLDKIRNQYRLFGKAIGADFDDEKYYNEASDAIKAFRDKYGKITFSIGECANADPFELSLAMLEYGFECAEIFGTVSRESFSYIKKIAELSPETRIYSNLAPSMLYYNGSDIEKQAEKELVCIGRDARFYHLSCKGIEWSSEIQPFGYSGAASLFDALEKVLEGDMVK